MAWELAPCITLKTDPLWKDMRATPLLGPVLVLAGSAVVVEAGSAAAKQTTGNALRTTGACTCTQLGQNEPQWPHKAHNRTGPHLLWPAWQPGMA